MIVRHVSICIPLNAANLRIVQVIVIPLFYEPSAIDVKLAKFFRRMFHFLFSFFFFFALGDLPIFPRQVAV